MQKTENNLDKIVGLCRRRGFIWPGSEVYGGLAGTWDFGPLGVALKRKIMQAWWEFFVEGHAEIFGIDAAILMNPKTWVASGHTATFSDPLVECKACHGRFRADHLVKDAGEADGSDRPDVDKPGTAKTGPTPAGSSIIPQSLKNVKCPTCGQTDWSEIRQFNMMFETHVGAVPTEAKSAKKADRLKADPSLAFLRPETAQGIFTNFKNVVDTIYPDLPFGLAQQGKAFRNEISPRDFIFRSREFEQMEIEYFVAPAGWDEHFGRLLALTHEFLEGEMGLPKKMIHEYEVPEADRAHYSKRTVDIEFDYPIGREELMGLAYRTDFDLQNIARASGKSQEYRDKNSGEVFVPHVVEPSFGVERLVMAVLTSAYAEDEAGGSPRTVLRLPAQLAPYRFCVSPLLKNKPELVAKAREVYATLAQKYHNVAWDDSGNIGKRYKKQDEIGTPSCVVVDFETLKNGTVTVRDRDSAEQERVKISEI